MNAVDQYIATFSLPVQTFLKEMRANIRMLAPDADESIAYGMPAYKLNGKPLVYFAAFKKHIGFYATPSGHQKFSLQLANYKQGKGSVQFPLDQPLPIELIREMIKFRVEENRKH